MAHEATTRAGESVVGRLAQFFPGSMAVRLPVRVTISDPQPRTPPPHCAQKQRASGTPGAAVPHNNAHNGDGVGKLVENTVIEYGTPREVLFASALPLEFEDRIHLETSDGSLTADADVVAVQYHEGKMAVAVRFAREISNWIIKK